MFPVQLALEQRKVRRTNQFRATSSLDLIQTYAFRTQTMWMKTQYIDNTHNIIINKGRRIRK